MQVFFFTLQDIVVRVLFILGNVAAKVDGARYQLYFESNALDCLLETVDGYLLLSFEVGMHLNFRSAMIQSADGVKLKRDIAVLKAEI